MAYFLLNHGIYMYIYIYIPELTHKKRKKIFPNIPVSAAICPALNESSKWDESVRSGPVCSSSHRLVHSLCCWVLWMWDKRLRFTCKSDSEFNLRWFYGLDMRCKPLFLLLLVIAIHWKCSESVSCRSTFCLC